MIDTSGINIATRTLLKAFGNDDMIPFESKIAALFSIFTVIVICMISKIQVFIQHLSCYVNFKNGKTFLNYNACHYGNIYEKNKILEIWEMAILSQVKAWKAFSQQFTI
jgi:hypothetical protein